MYYSAHLFSNSKKIYLQICEEIGPGIGLWIQSGMELAIGLKLYKTGRIIGAHVSGLDFGSSQKKITTHNQGKCETRKRKMFVFKFLSHAVMVHKHIFWLAPEDMHSRNLPYMYRAEKQKAFSRRKSF